MAKNTNYTTKDITGPNIYRIKNQTIYYNKFDKTAYIITNSNVQKFSTWQLRTSLSIILACLLILFKLNFFFAIGIALLVYVVSTIIFNVKYLPTLPVSTNFVKPASLGFFKDLAARYTKTNLTIVFVMFLSIAFMMFFTGFISNEYTGSDAVVSYVFIGIDLLMALFVFIILKVKKKNNL